MSHKKGAPVERSWVLVGQVEANHWLARTCRPSSGAPHQVEADWRWALAREEARGDVLGFLHTHPAGSGTTPSARDRQTMLAWCAAFGKPLLCLIRDRRTLAGWLFLPHHEDPLPVNAHQTGPGAYAITRNEEH